MFNGLSLMAVGGDLIAGEGLKNNKDQADKAETADWGTEEATEPEEPMQLEAAPSTKLG
jgi:hypothetical protein